MKQHLQKLMVVLTLLLLCIPIQMYAQSTRTVNQLQFGKQTVTVASDEEITFYDPWGTADIVDNNSYNSQSLTVFKPAEEGKSIQITFETIDLNQYSANYFLYMNLYDGEADADNTFTWASSSSQVTSSSSLTGLSGTLIAEKINNSNKPSLPVVYTSGTANGALSVGFMHRNSNKCAGWVAKVKCIKLENMTVTGAGSNYDGVINTPNAKQNISLANVFVTATGVMSPDHVTGIHFNLTKNENAIDPTALKLFKDNTQVDATVVADGTGYKFTLNEALGEGTTSFTVKGDFLGTAEIGAKVQIDITKVTTNGIPDGVTPFTPGTSVEVTNPAIVLMTTAPQTITVNETPLNFFDEGGPQAGVECRANGTVTFIPGVTGKKVMVDFSMIDIFRGSLYNQEIRVYNGTSANADNLVKTFQDGETGTVRSTSPDGALTIVLFSDALTATLNDGFEALVSLFTPQAMTLNTITANHPTNETLVAADEDQQILSFNITTENTEPALEAQKFAFNTNGTYPQITKATLYYTAAENAFKTSKKVGETVISADAFEITATMPVTLLEGDNYFWLAYNINDEAINGQKVDAAILSATISGTTTNVVNGSPDGERIVENVALSYQNMGTITKKVNGSLEFKTKPYSAVPSKYEPGTDDRTNVFIPMHEGKVIQLDFTAFDVYYSTSSWGQKADFKVYSGQGTSGELLWSIDNQKGPGKVLRSTAADGSMTIVFNPKASTSTYCAAGWTATVSEYQSQPMQIDSIVATHPSTAVVSVGAKKQELLDVKVFTTGDQDAVSLSEMTFDLKGKQQNVEKLYVTQNDAVIGETTVAEDQTVTVTLTTPVELAEGENTFKMSVDVSPTADDGETIDAKIISVKAGESNVNATNGDPEGERLLKSMIIATNGDNGEIKVGTGKSVMFYDDGGPNADGADGVEATITFAPLEEGATIKLIDK
ncbi:MAG: hypothetical protein IKG83_03555 [Prevotella sp.]|nr:hypothetical protein [Prevotella sp.]